MMANTQVLKLGTRDIEMGIQMTDIIVKKLSGIFPNLNIEIVRFAQNGTRRESTKELEDALTSHVVDAVVHPTKDVFLDFPDNLAIGGVNKRESCYDAVVMHPKHAGKTLEDLPEGSVIGTSSMRRASQLLKKYPNLIFENMKGYLNSRFQKLDEDNKYDAIILAEAGLRRLGLDHRISQVLDDETAMYAVGQGAIAVQCRLDDMTSRQLLATIHDRSTALQCVAERSFIKTLEEGKNTAPVCVRCLVTEDQVSLTGAVCSLDGNRIHDTSSTFSFSDFRQNNPQDECFNEKFMGILPNTVVDNADMRTAARIGEEVAKKLLNSELAVKLMSEVTEEKNKLKQLKATKKTKE